MTLCIAAACRHDGQSAVVTCADWQITGPQLAAEDYYKLRHYPNATIMISGELAAADDFCFDLQEAIKDCNAIAQTDGELEQRVGQYLERLRRAARERKRIRAEHQIAMKYGLSLDRFYRKASLQMPKWLYKKIIDEIQEVKLDVYTIVVYSGDRQLLILRTGPRGGIFWERNYTAIGSGALIANTVLCQTPHDSSMSLLNCLVRVVTAKASAERDPYVGPNTSLGIILGDGSRYDVSNDVWQYLMQRINTPAVIPTRDDEAQIVPLGRRLQESETGQARYTSDPRVQF
jgi:hypothetical protein